MALTDFERYLLYDTSMQLWQQSFLTNALFYGGSVGQSLRTLALGEQPVRTLTNPYDEAITGTLRADARATLQNSKNVTEAAAMVGIAETSTASIKTMLEDMKELVEGLTSNPTAAQEEEYDSLRDNILAAVSNTDYNGMYLLDGTKWGTDQIDSNGNVYIQAYKNGGFDVNFHDVEALDFSALDSSHLGNAAGRTAELAAIDSRLSSITTIDDMYTDRQSDLEFQAARLESQAELLAQAAEARRQTPTVSVEDLLLNLLLRESGSLVDSTG